MAAARSTSRYGCHTSVLTLASRRRWPPAAAWCATSSRPHGGRWLTHPETRSTSPPLAAGPETFSLTLRRRFLPPQVLAWRAFEPEVRHAVTDGRERGQSGDEFSVPACCVHARLPP